MPTGCTVLLLDPPDRQGHAGRALDDQSRDRIVESLRAIWVQRPVLVATSPYAADARRLRALSLPDAGAIVVVRPAAALLPAPVLQRALDHAIERAFDVATLADVPGEICYIASARAIEVVASLGGIPGCTTLPQALNRLRAAGAVLDDDSLRVGTVAGLDAPTPALAAAVSVVRDQAQLTAVLSLPSESRLDAVLRLQHEAFSDARAELHQLGSTRARAPRGVHKGVLVVAPSMYQSGAHAAWAELSHYLSPHQVAFVIGAGTALAGILRTRGFTVFEVLDGLDARSARDAAALMAALDAVRPGVVHFDGAEGSSWAGSVYARGARVVQHVRLNDVDRFRPAFVYADAVVGVSAQVCRDIEVAMGSSLRVEHVPDGVCLQSRPERNASVAAGLSVNPVRPVTCLCIGRVEPAKGQLRVLEIFRCLRDLVPSRLLIVGPCGRDPAYCDEVRDRTAGGHLDGEVTWLPFRSGMDDLYAQADVVLVGSRNEALGMVGLETLASGALLVAQRSTGYSSIIDAAHKEGLLFEAAELPSAVAARIVDALGERATYARNGRRKVEACFDARDSATRLASLWSELVGVR